MPKHHPKRKSKLPRKKLLIAMAIVFVVSLVSGFIWQRSHNPEPPVEEEVVTAMETPEKCATAAHICLLTDWPDQAGFVTSDDFFGLISHDEVTTLTYVDNTSGKKEDPGCPATCTLTVISATEVKQFKNTLIVKAVYRISSPKFIEPYIFLISKEDYEHADYAVNREVPVSYSEPSPVFVHRYDGKVMMSQLIAQSYKPGNYKSYASAVGWFDTISANGAAYMISNVETN